MCFWRAKEESGFGQFLLVVLVSSVQHFTWCKLEINVFDCAKTKTCFLFLTPLSAFPSLPLFLSCPLSCFSLSARRLTQCSCCCLPCSILGTYVLLRWQMLIQPSLLTCSCWREVSAPRHMTWVTCVEVGWSWRGGGCFTITHLVFCAIILESCLAACQHLLKVQTVTCFLRHFFCQNVTMARRARSYSHTSSLLGSVFSPFLRLAPSLCNCSMCCCDPWPQWDGKQMTSAPEWERAPSLSGRCDVMASDVSKGILGRCHLFLPLVYEFCSEIHWWLTAASSADRLTRNEL